MNMIHPYFVKLDPSTSHRCVRRVATQGWIRSPLGRLRMCVCVGGEMEGGDGGASLLARKTLINLAPFSFTVFIIIAHGCTICKRILITSYNIHIIIGNNQHMHANKKRREWH